MPCKMDGISWTISYVIKYKKANTNIVTNALCMRHALFSKLGA